MSDAPEDSRRYPRRGAGAKSRALNTEILASGKSSTKPQCQSKDGVSPAPGQIAGPSDPPAPAPKAKPTARSKPASQPKQKGGKKGKGKKAVADVAPAVASADNPHPENDHRLDQSSVPPPSPAAGESRAEDHSTTQPPPAPAPPPAPPAVPQAPVVPPPAPTPPPAPPAVPQAPVVPPPAPTPPPVPPPAPPVVPETPAVPPPAPTPPVPPAAPPVVPEPPAVSPRLPPAPPAVLRAPAVPPLAPRPPPAPPAVLQGPAVPPLAPRPPPAPPTVLQGPAVPPLAPTAPPVPPPAPPAVQQHDAARPSVFDSALPPLPHAVLTNPALTDRGRSRCSDSTLSDNVSETQSEGGDIGRDEEQWGDLFGGDYPRNESRSSRQSETASRRSFPGGQEDDDDGADDGADRDEGSAPGIPKQPTGGRRRDAVLESTTLVNQELNRVLQAASEEYEIPQEIFVKAFLKERELINRGESTWNIFQRMIAAEKKEKGEGKESREETSARFQQFKLDNEDWEAQLDAFHELYLLDRLGAKTYLSQQRDMERLFRIFQIHADRAHLAHFEVIFAIIGSSIFQNDALNRLFFSPGLKNFSIKRLGVSDEEFLGLLMTEACDTAAEPVTEFVRDTISRNRDPAKPGPASEAPDSPKPAEAKKGKNQAKKDKKGGSTTVTIASRDINPPRPNEVVLPTGETIVIPIKKDAVVEDALYDENLKFVKSIVRSIIEAGWCLRNYPANTQMPGEIPPGVDVKKYIHEGLRVIKRPALAAFVREIIHPDSPRWELVKGNRHLMETNCMPVIIQAPPVLSPEEEERLIASKKSGKTAASGSNKPLPQEFGRRFYCNTSYDYLGPAYVVRDELDEVFVSDDDDDDSEPDTKQARAKSRGKGKAKAKGKAKGRGKGKVAGKPLERSLSPPAQQAAVGSTPAPQVMVNPPTPQSQPPAHAALQQYQPPLLTPSTQPHPGSLSPHIMPAALPPSPVASSLTLPPDPRGIVTQPHQAGAHHGAAHQVHPSHGHSQPPWIAPGNYQAVSPTPVPYAGQQYGYAYHQVPSGSQPGGQNHPYQWTGPGSSQVMYAPNPSADFYYNQGQHQPGHHWVPSPHGLPPANTKGQAVVAPTVSNANEPADTRGPTEGQ
ncbi:hypothetical protein MD484_g7864, partial [Candolleomyces efflorescens]